MMNKFLEKMKGAKALPLLLLAAVLCLALCLMPEEPKGAMTEEEMRISRTLSRIQGAGECAVSIWYENETGAFGSGEKRPSGIIILSQGAQDLSVRLLPCTEKADLNTSKTMQILMAAKETM